MRVTASPKFQILIRTIQRIPVARIETFDYRTIALAFASKPPAEIIQRIKDLGFIWNPAKGWWDAPVVTRENMHPLSDLYDVGKTPQLNKDARELFAKFETEGYFSLFWATMFWACENTETKMRGYSTLFAQIPLSYRHVSMEYIGNFMKWVISAYEAGENLDYKSVETCFRAMAENAK